MSHTRTTTPETLFQMAYDGPGDGVHGYYTRYVMRRDRVTPSLIWQKRQWPRKWYWRQMTAQQWAQLPPEVAAAAAAFFGLPVPTPRIAP